MLRVCDVSFPSSFIVHVKALIGQNWTNHWSASVINAVTYGVPAPLLTLQYVCSTGSDYGDKGGL